MRYAVIADLHGHADRFADILAAAEKAAVDELVLLGDYLEARVSKRYHDPARHWRLEEVVAPDPDLWRSLAGHRLVLGNQEERIADLLRPEQVGPRLLPLLSAPGRQVLGGRMELRHGHTFDWKRSGGQWVPGARDLAGPDRPVLCYGHSHRRLAAVVIGTTHEPEFRMLGIRPGEPIELRSGRRYVVNLGAAREPAGHWLVYDDAQNTITFQETAA